MCKLLFRLHYEISPPNTFHFWSRFWFAFRSRGRKLGKVLRSSCCLGTEEHTRRFAKSRGCLLGSLQVKAEMLFLFVFRTDCTKTRQSRSSCCKSELGSCRKLFQLDRGGYRLGIRRCWSRFWSAFPRPGRKLGKVLRSSCCLGMEEHTRRFAKLRGCHLGNRQVKEMRLFLFVFRTDCTKTTRSRSSCCKSELGSCRRLFRSADCA